MNYLLRIAKMAKDMRLISALERLAEEAADHKREYSLSALADIVHSESQEALAIALGDAIKRGMIQRVIRIVSPENQGGIGDYSSLNDIPNVVRDWRADRDMEVRPDNLRVVYIFPSRNDSARGIQKRG